MPPARCAQISSFRFGNKRQCAFPHPSTAPPASSLFRPSGWGPAAPARFPPDYPRFHQPQRQMRALREGTRIGAFCANGSTFVTTPGSTTTRCATSSAAGHSFDPGQQSHLAAGITSAARKKAVCARASFSRIGWSDGIRMTLNCCAADLFKRMGQLQHPSFAERRPKNLQPHW
jgi:hypothetical protein